MGCWVGPSGPLFTEGWWPTNNRIYLVCNCFRRPLCKHKQALTHNLTHIYQVWVLLVPAYATASFRNAEQKWGSEFNNEIY